MAALLSVAALFAALILPASAVPLKDVEGIMPRHRAQEAWYAALLEQHALSAAVIQPEKDLHDGAFVRWDVGTQYRYEFTSKAAHTEYSLPVHDKVNPHTQLEDLGLYPFALVQGTMVLDVQCQVPSDGSTSTKVNSSAAELTKAGGPRADVLVKVSFQDIKSECDNDASRSKQDCGHLNEQASALSQHPFWVYVNAAGEQPKYVFDNADSSEVSGIKKSLIRDLALSTPDPKKKEKPELFLKAHKEGTGDDQSKVTTRFRVQPFVRGPPEKRVKGNIDGFLIRKEMATHKAGDNGKEGLLRDTWTYMVVGGDMDQQSMQYLKSTAARTASSGAVAVPTHVSSIDEINVVGSAATPPQQSSKKGGSKDGKDQQPQLYVLTRVGLSLRKIQKTAEKTGACSPV